MSIAQYHINYANIHVFENVSLDEESLGSRIAMSSSQLFLACRLHLHLG